VLAGRFSAVLKQEGFESWWGPVGFRAELHAIEPRVNGRLHYDMIAYTPEMVEAMKQMGRPSRMERVPGSPNSARPLSRGLNLQMAVTRQKEIHVVEFGRSEATISRKLKWS
jgi:hypothetical protein